MQISTEYDWLHMSVGVEPDIFIWGATGGASFATRGAVNGLCRTFRKRPENFWGGHWGSQAKFFGGSGPPWYPPSSAPACQCFVFNLSPRQM